MTGPEAFRASFDRAGAELTVVLDGELDITTAPAFADQVRREAGGDLEQVVLDLSGLRYCDSSGLAAFVAVHRHLQERGASAGIRRPQPIVLQVLQVTGLDEVIPILD